MLHPLLEATLEIKKMRLDLERFRSFEEKLGSPSRAFQSIHIAGTNGKGTVSFKTAAALQVSGKKVGLFTSPHIHTYHERIQINQIPISDEDCGRLLEKINGVLKEELTYFETMTLLAFLYFSENKVDVAVLEVGMGGRLDTTNIVTPLLSVITSIGLDHTRYLGDTLDKIAFEKAGIIKPGIPVVIGPHAKPKEVFEKVSKERKAPLLIVEETSGDYEEDNVAVVMKVLSNLPFLVTVEAFNVAKTARLPCRFEEVYPRVIFDVGHNPPALERTFEKLAKKYPKMKVRVLAAFSSDKEISQMLSLLNQEASFIHLTKANHERACTLSQMEPLCDNMDWEPNFDAAFEKAFHLSRLKDEVLLVCGTFFIMDAALSKLNWVRDLD